MLTKVFRRALKKAGFEITKKCRTADIIVAHSAGIYAIPSGSKASLLVLINPTYWPGRRLITRVGNFAIIGPRFYVKNFGWRFYIKKRLLEAYYFITRSKYMWLGTFHNNRLGHIEELAEAKDRRIIIIRNHNDSFTTPQITGAVSHLSNVIVKTLPGIHDDFYVNPEPYIKIIKETT